MDAKENLVRERRRSDLRKCDRSRAISASILKALDSFLRNDGSMKWLLVMMLASAPCVADVQRQWQSEIVPILESYCFDCHADGIKKGDFSFDAFPDVASMQAKRDAWKRVRENLAYELMPPPDRDQPTSDERKKLIAWIDAAVFPVDPNNPDPGRVTLRRLNRFEYRNTVRDLIGVTPDIQLLPPDDAGYGFDNIADVLTLSPTHLDSYLTAASQALDQAYRKAQPPRQKLPRESFQGQYEKYAQHIVIPSNRRLHRNVRLEAGRHRAVFYISGQQAGPDRVKARLSFGSQTKTISLADNKPKYFSLELESKAGEQTVAIEFLNDYYEEATKKDRNLLIHQVSVLGPIKSNVVRPAFFPERPSAMGDEAYAALALRHFLSRAFRRPVANEEIARYAALAKSQRSPQQSLEESLRVAFEAAMVSPQFLFREMHAVYAKEKPGTILPVPELALASRISYFLWSSAPEDSTLSLAAQKQLRQNAQREVERMIRSPKSSALIERFFAQWLQYQDVAFIPIDKQLYPSARQLRKDFVEETRRFCDDLLRNNQPITRLIDADYTFVNERLAQHYGIPQIQGETFRKVSLAQQQRRGVLTHAAILAVTSNPNRTSPVKRGKWVLETLLDAAPPPPPPNVPSLPAAKHGQSAATLRQQLETHRKDPACASCHKLMDGIGFAFEGFDVDGRFRGPDIDTRGQLSTGETVDSPAALARLIAGQRVDEFHRAFAAKLLTFALGRGLDYYDKPAVDQIVVYAAKHDHRVQSYLHAVIQSYPFQHYRR